MNFEHKLTKDGDCMNLHTVASTGRKIHSMFRASTPECNAENLNRFIKYNEDALS